MFLARFCFLSLDGKFSYDIEYSTVHLKNSFDIFVEHLLFTLFYLYQKDYAVQKLLLYYDTPYQWPAAYSPSKVDIFLKFNRGWIKH